MSAYNQNERAWEAASYEAWLKAYGTPTEAATKLKADPASKLRRLLPHLGEVAGKRVVNPLGSHGRVAVALTLLGAEVTVLDLSEPNRRYALELAQAAGVNINYVMTDLLELDLKPYREQFDVAVLELGVVYYFPALEPFVGVLHALLEPGGRLVLNDFHPVRRKLFDSRGERLTSGDYFANGLKDEPVAYTQFLSETDLPSCRIKQHTLGDVVTAFAETGFRVEGLHEYPDWDEPTLPGTFTLVARRL